MDRFESMSAFVAVVEAGGFSAASRKLGMPLATVSRKVSELEEQLSVQLLVRSTRNVSLTENGQQYFASCRRLLDELGEAERQVSGEYRAPKGGLVVSAPIVFGRLYLTPIIVDFLKAYPEVHIELRLADSIAHLLEEQVDIALRIGELPDSGIIAARAGEIRHVVVASPAYLKERGIPAHPRELSAHDCVTFLALHAPDEWIFKLGKRTEKYPVQSRLAVNTAEAAADAAIAGLGITRLLCYQVSKAIAERSLTLLMRDHEPIPLPVHLVYTGGRLIPQKLRAFLDFVLPRLKAKLVFDPQ
jgi:DNA-binding transcriptional LysR family regulator